MEKYIWHTPKDTAKLLDVSHGTVLDMIKRGDFGEVLKVGNRYRIEERQIEQFIKFNTLTPDQVRETEISKRQTRAADQSIYAPVSRSRGGRRRHIPDSPKLQ